jgi:hypothetical protein
LSIFPAVLPLAALASLFAQKGDATAPPLLVDPDQSAGR